LDDGAPGKLAVPLEAAAAKFVLGFKPTLPAHYSRW